MNKTSKLIVGRWFLALLIGGGAVSAALAQGTLSGTATLSGVQNGSLYDYTITLSNNGSGPIGTFWYAWIPGYFFLPSTPASETAPTGWTASTPVNTHAIEYNANSSASELAGGSSLNFYFTSTDTPAALAGNVPSSYYGNGTTPIGTSYIYGGTTAFSDSGYEFVVQSVPEPSALALLAVGFLSLASVWRWKLRRRGTYIS